MENSPTLIDLPVEVIYYMLNDAKLTICDIFHLSTVCKKLNVIITGENGLWKRKCFLSWPWLKDICDTHYTDSDDPNLFLKEFTECKRKFNNLFLEHVTQRAEPRQPLSYSELKKFEDLFDSKQKGSPLQFRIIKHDLYVKFLRSKRKNSSPLLRRIGEILHHTVNTHVAISWRDFLKLPAVEQFIEEPGVLALKLLEDSKHVQKFERFQENFDVIADATKIRLIESWPEHPMASIPEEKLEFWRKNLVAHNQWNAEQSKQILWSLYHTIYEKLVKYPDIAVYSPLEVATMIEGVARRLGVRCSVVKAGYGDLNILWRSDYDPNVGIESFCLQFNCSKRKIVMQDLWEIFSINNKYEYNIENLPEVRADLLKEIQQVPIFNADHETKQKLCLEHLNRVRIPDNLDDFLVLSALYVDLRTIEWCVQPFLLKMKYFGNFCAITKRIESWLDTWHRSYGLE